VYHKKFLDVKRRQRSKSQNAVFMILVFMLLTSSSSAFSQLGKDLGEKNEGTRGLNASDNQVASGLREALTVAANNAVALTGVPDGFWGNQAIRIQLPGKMASLEKGLRMMGQGLKLDDFELAMNRSAEAAAPAAASIFAKTIANMALTDARTILNGGNTAATDYLKRTCLTELTVAFRPAVESTMSKTAVVERYNALSTQMKALTLGQADHFDIDSYVVSKTIDGLVFVMGKEEARIRGEASARSTPALKELFGRN
jgi:hypothetical protein